jgi:hypothetical protein
VFLHTKGRYCKFEKKRGMSEERTGEITTLKAIAYNIHDNHGCDLSVCPQSFLSEEVTKRKVSSSCCVLVNLVFVVHNS